MFFRNYSSTEQNVHIAERIKNEIITTLESKGVKISDIEIDTKSGKLKLSVSIKEKNQ